MNLFVISMNNMCNVYTPAPPTQPANKTYDRRSMDLHKRSYLQSLAGGAPTDDEEVNIQIIIHLSLAK